NPSQRRGVNHRLHHRKYHPRSPCPDPFPAPVSERLSARHRSHTAEGIGRDASDLLRKIKAAQYVAAHPGEVCPAKWKEGEATLAPSLDLVGKI
ncbi:hypothetical protein MJI95_23190, partial [Salmonella enterica subsp. enterica serovar Kentucky]|nr:hypothetical protein [Salmonella enterica subsp. enterica serovar Kentucky]